MNSKDPTESHLLTEAWARENAEAIDERRRWIAEHGVPLAALQVLKI